MHIHGQSRSEPTVQRSRFCTHFLTQSRRLQGKEIAIQAKYSGSVPTYTIDGSNRQTRSQKLLEMAAEKAKIEEEKAAQVMKDPGPVFQGSGSGVEI
jgi:hypothetical protein